MHDANASPFDVFAFVSFIMFGGIKVCLPRLLSKRAAARRFPGRWARVTLTALFKPPGCRSTAANAWGGTAVASRSKWFWRGLVRQQSANRIRLNVFRFPHLTRSAAAALWQRLFLDGDQFGEYSGSAPLFGTYRNARALTWIPAIGEAFLVSNLKGIGP